MTALNFHIQPDEIYIAMDTLAISPPSAESFLYTTKFYFLPHLKMIICGTGLAKIIIDWFVRVNTSMLVQDVCHLNEFTVNALRDLGSQYALSEKLTATIYHFGWSELENCFTGFAYRSEKDFQSERLGYGTGIKPHFDQIDWVDGEGIDFIKIIKQQRLLDRQRPLNQQVGIGGEIHMIHMNQNGTSIVQLHRFDDYDDEYAQMIKHLSQ